MTAVVTEKNVMHVMDSTGDTKIVWSPDNPEEVANAKRSFDELVGKKKYLAYAVNEDGGKGQIIRTFDKTAGRIIMSPQLVGG